MSGFFSVSTRFHLIKHKHSVELTASKTVKSTINHKDLLGLTSTSEREKWRKDGKSYVLYKHELFRLFDEPKPARSRLMFNLPSFMGFRSEEVCTWDASYIDFQSHHTLVLDAKKHSLFEVPLPSFILDDAEEVLQGRTEGPVIQNQSRAWKDRREPLSIQALRNEWLKWAKRLNLRPDWRDYTPIVGRRFFIKWWLSPKHDKDGREVPGCDVVACSKIVRHGSPGQTLDYANKITFQEDVDIEAARFEQQTMEALRLTHPTQRKLMEASS